MATSENTLIIIKSVAENVVANSLGQEHLDAINERKKC